jgi:hypothetical protein
MRSFQSLSEQEILALAIALEEEDARIYGGFESIVRPSDMPVSDSPVAPLPDKIKPSGVALADRWLGSYDERTPLQYA